MNHYTQDDRANEADARRETRANNDDGSKGGYNIRPNIFKPSRLLTFRACRNYLYTYALLETVASKRASRLDRGRIRMFLYWNRSVQTHRAMYGAMFKAIDARRAAEAQTARAA